MLSMYPSTLRSAVLAICTWSASMGPGSVAGEILGTQLAFDQMHYQRAGRPQIVRRDVRFEDREQCAGVGEREALARAEPGQVRIPVLTLWSQASGSASKLSSCRWPTRFASPNLTYSSLIASVCATNSCPMSGSAGSGSSSARVHLRGCHPSRDGLTWRRSPLGATMKALAIATPSSQLA